MPNPSFEEHTQCPNNGGQIDYALYWTNPLIGGGSTPDYLNTCGAVGWRTPNNVYGYEIPHSGIAYTSIFTAKYSPFAPQSNNAREYIQAKLLDTLQANKEYCLSFFVSAADSMLYVSDNIGAYFSNNEIRDTCQTGWCNLAYQPQIENNALNNLNSRAGWTKVSGTYKANGGESYITIGNFRDTTATTATYVGWSQINSYFYALYYIDDVFLEECQVQANSDMKEGDKSTNVFPNPSSNYLTIQTVSNSRIVGVTVSNALGQVITEIGAIYSVRETIDVSSYPTGIYVISVFTTDNKKIIFKNYKI